MSLGIVADACQSAYMGLPAPRFSLVIPRPKKTFPSQHTLHHLNGYFKTSLTRQVIQESSDA